MNQSTKKKNCLIPLRRGFYNSQTHGNREQNGGCQGLGGGGNEELLLNGYTVSILQGEKVLGLGCTTM